MSHRRRPRGPLRYSRGWSPVWQQTVSSLTGIAAASIIDISDPSEHLLWELGECLKALSGMDEFALQPQGGAHAIFANVLIIKAYHASRGDDTRDEMISTFATHPTNPAAASAAGFKIIEVPVGDRGYVEIDTLKEISRYPLILPPRKVEPVCRPLSASQCGARLAVRHDREG